MLTVWGRRSSFNLQKVMWLVGELGIEHRHVEAGGRFGGLDAPEFRAMNPHGRIPVIDEAKERRRALIGSLGARLSLVYHLGSRSFISLRASNPAICLKTTV